MPELVPAIEVSSRRGPPLAESVFEIDEYVFSGYIFKPRFGLGSHVLIELEAHGTQQQHGSVSGQDGEGFLDGHVERRPARPADRERDVGLSKPSVRASHSPSPPSNT